MVPSLSVLDGPQGAQRRDVSLRSGPYFVLGGRMTRGQKVSESWKFIRHITEVYTNEDSFKTREEWVAALDETLTDLSRSQGLEPKVTLLGVLEEMSAA